MRDFTSPHTCCSTFSCTQMFLPINEVFWHFSSTVAIVLAAQAAALLMLKLVFEFLPGVSFLGLMKQPFVLQLQGTLALHRPMLREACSRLGAGVLYARVPGSPTAGCALLRQFAACHWQSAAAHFATSSQPTRAQEQQQEAKGGEEREQEDDVHRFFPLMVGAPCASHVIVCCKASAVSSPLLSRPSMPS